MLSKHKHGLTVKVKIDLKMHVHLPEANFRKLRIWRPEEALYRYAGQHGAIELNTYQLMYAMVQRRTFNEK